MKKLLLLSFFLVSIIGLKAQICYTNTYDTTNLAASVYVVTEDHNGNLFFGYKWNNGGFTKFDGTTWTTFDTTNTSGGLINDQVMDIVFDYSGNMYIGTYMGISKFDGTTWADITNATTSGGLANNSINDLMFDNAGNLWVAHSGGISKFDGIAWHSWGDVDVPMMYSVEKLLEDKNGNIWAAYYGGVVKYDGDTTWTQYSTNDGLCGTDVYDMTMDKDGNLWFMTGWSGVSKFDGVSTWESFMDVNNDTVNDLEELQSVTVDIFGNIWFCKYMGGAYRYDGTNWRQFATNEGLPDQGLNTVYASKNGSVWFGIMDGAMEFEAKGNFYTTSNIPQDYFQDNEAEVNLYQISLDASQTIPQLMYTQPVVVEGIADFTGVELGKYIIQTKMINNTIHPNILTSYFNGDTIAAYQWEQAVPVFLDYCTTLAPEILMKSFIMPTTGVGIISGYIYYTGGNKSIMGEPVPGAEITLEQEPDDEPICATTTGADGKYEFVDVLTEGNTYSLRVDVPGFPMQTTHSGISVGDTASVFSFVVDTTTIAVNMVNAISTIETEKFNLNIYPNPFVDKITVDFILEEKADVEFQIFDQAGKQIMNENSENYLKGKYTKSLTMDNSLSNGYYFMQIKINNTFVYKKLLLEK